ncbi:MAG: hypothetical protein J6D04_04230, partial [Clostridia bacterium]|nr:hypothetical protein [Clostridia bacterium]
MKKFLMIVVAVILVLLALDYAYFHMGIYLDFDQDEPTSFMKVEGETIYKDGVPFEIRGVNMGSGIPGDWSTDFAVDKETYLRWFGYIQKMGANT